MRERLKYRSVPLDNATHFHYNFHCSTPGCRKYFTYKSKNVIPDDAVIQNAAREMKKRGWVPGRTQDSGICPTCVGVEPKNRMASKFKVLEGGKPVVGADEIAKVFGDKREGAVKSVLRRIKAEQAPEPTQEPEPVPTASSVDLTPVLEELKANRVAFEFMFDQQAKMIELMQQTINAISNIVPHLSKGNENIVSQLQRIEQGLSVIIVARPETKPEPVVVFAPPVKKSRRKRNET